MLVPSDVYEEDEFLSEEGVEPSLTYDINTGIQIDHEQAMLQAVTKILDTEYGDSDYYTQDYGRILEDLVGASISTVRGVLSKRVTEALLLDDRVLSVGGFQYIESGNLLSCTFSMETIYGYLEGSTSVTTG
jgi:hypothetical protein